MTMMDAYAEFNSNNQSNLYESKDGMGITQWKSRVLHEKKVAIVKDIHKLQIQIQAMEREKGTHIYSKRNHAYTPDFQQLHDLEMSHNDERQREKDKLAQQLEKISSMVRKLGRELQGTKPTAAFVERLKVTLGEVESTITSYKEQQRHRYEELLSSEKSLSHEIGALNAKYDSWSQLSSATPRSVKVAGSSSTRDVTADLPEDVAVFENYVLKNGGVRGGWDEYDQQIFLKLWTRHKSRISELLEELRSAIPTRSDTQIREHVAWYREYVRLDEGKKAAIQAWRHNKQVEKELITDRTDEVDDGRDRERRRQEALEEERQERFSKLNSWKVQNEIKKEVAQEVKDKEKEECRRKEITERHRQLEVKSRILEYKQQKEEDEAFLESQRIAWEGEEEREKRVLSARERERFLDRDQQKLHNKLEQKRQQVEEKERKVENLNKIKEHVPVQRDRSRLYQPTEGWKHRLSDTQTDSRGPSLQMPHRAIPTWRQGNT